MSFHFLLAPFLPLDVCAWSAECVVATCPSVCHIRILYQNVTDNHQANDTEL